MAKTEDQTDRKTQDRVEITELIGRYSILYDAGAIKEMSVLFTEDAVFDVKPEPSFFRVPLIGREQIEAEIGKRHAEIVKTGYRRHFNTNTIFHNISNESASTSTYLILLGASNNSPLQLLGTGMYHDEFKRDGGRWLFSKRSCVMESWKTSTE
jgi:hypothetical protein